jgi:importin-9
VPQSDRIMTRSRARQSIYPYSQNLGDILTPLPDPDRFTIVPATLKIIKVLVEELLSASGSGRSLAGTGTAADSLGADDAASDDDNDEWEDDPDDALNQLAGGLGSGNSLKQSENSMLDKLMNGSGKLNKRHHADLMAFAEETPYSNRQRDDETQAYLIQFFRDAAQKPNFEQYFNALTQEEQEKLRSYG